MRAHHELTASGITTRAATTLTGVVRSTAARDKARPAAAGPAGTTAARTPENKLTAAERRAVLDVLCSDRFVDQAPLEVYASLLDEGIYLCSVSTMYRILRENAQVKERRRQARHPARACPELVATAPRQVYSWDITKLPGPVKGTYFDAYVMIDIFSRYIVGAHVQTHESGLLAAEMMTEVFAVQGVPNVVHADRGTSMTSKTVATLLADLEVTRSHSRPQVSNDNPYSDYAGCSRPSSTDRCGRSASPRSTMRERSWTRSPRGTTTNIVIPASGCILLRMCTSDSLDGRLPNARPCWPRPGWRTPNGSGP